MIKTYVALTNAMPSPSDPHQFSFRSGDKLKLNDEEAKVLLDARAIQLLGPEPPAEVAPRRGAGKGGGRTGSDE